MVEGEKTNYREANRDKQLQSVEEIMQIIQEAKIPGEGVKVDGLLGTGSLDADDADVDLESEIDYSAEFMSPV